jgi:cysteine-rich repeat protein
MRVAFVLCVFVAAAAGCVSSNNVQCDDGRVCPQASVCDTTQHLCVDQAQLDDCRDIADREPCMIGATPGTCQQGTCLPSGCGNGRLDLVADEVCDDGNNTDGDKCSANCLSDESCGNHVIDVVNDEQCDDGNRLDHDGCASACEQETPVWVTSERPTPLSSAAAAYDAGRDRVVIIGGRRPDTAPRSPALLVSEWDGSWRTNIERLGPFTRDQPFNPSTPGARFAAAYMPDLRMTVVTGGRVNQTTLREVWGWDGAKWMQLPNMPDARDGHAMAYDAKRKRLVVFGGCTSIPGEAFGGCDLHDDTWEFDGTTWTTITTPNKPSARYGSHMVYDSTRGKIVMYGGIMPSETQSQLWEYDGTDWSMKRDTFSGAPSLTAPQVAYDSASASTIIYGPTTQNQPNQMWRWDGTDLTQISTTLPASDSTTERCGGILVPDGTGRLLLFGGESSCGATDAGQVTQNLMYFFDGSSDTWTKADPEPPLGLFHVMVTQFDAGSVLRFDGAKGGAVGATADTWELTRRGWQLTTTTNPPGIGGTALAYDTDRHEAVLFGGLTSAAETNHVWTRPPGGTWVEHLPTGSWPTARFGAGLAYDEARQRTLMFGGRPAGDSLTPSAADAMWSWDGATSTWMQLTPATMPPPRTQGAFAYDPVHQVAVLFGGIEANESLNDTWVWDGTTWTDLTPTFDDMPGATQAVSLIWNPARQAFVLVPPPPDLESEVLEVWELALSSPTAGTWRRVPATPPMPRFFSAVFATLDGSGITVDGGADQSFGALDSRVELTWQGPRAADSCRRPEDIDGDGLVMCGSDDGTPPDPDCWRVCTPDCPPGTSCLAESSQCGDGTCSGAETCRSCPDDCHTCTVICGDAICDAGESCAADCP